MGNFQTQVYPQPAPAVEGDFCSKNPRYNVLAGPGGMIAGSAGVTVGRFAWAFPPLDADGGPAVVQNSGWGPVTGFVGRRQGAGLITTFLADASMVINAGLPVTLYDSAEFWAKNTGSGEAQAGMKAFANMLTGAVTFAAAGSFPGGASDSGGVVAATTLTLTGSVSDNVLTVTAESAGKPYPGAVLSSNAIGTVIKQLTNASGAISATNPADYGVGTYLLDTGEQTVAAGTTIGGYYGVYTVGTATGTFAVGMYLSGGTTLPTSPPPVLTLLLTGTGGNSSTFVTSGGNVAQSSHALVGNTAIETKWYARSTGLQNELVKISDKPLG